MTRRRWIADEWSADRASLLGAHAEHLARVLRARVGQEFDISAGGSVRRGRIIRVAPERVDFELENQVGRAATPELAVALGIFKFDRFEWAIEKLTELGASRIIPFGALRTDTHLLAAAGKRLDRWRRIALAASEQSRRATPPIITGVARLRDVLELPAPLRIVLSESAAPKDSLTSLLALPATTPGGIAIAIGPEGGWRDDELHEFAESGWKQVSLGLSILRSETAAIAAVAIAAALCGEPLTRTPAISGEQ